eukprot:2781151-Prymnesium_polylepis.1
MCDARSKAERDTSDNGHARLTGRLEVINKWSRTCDIGKPPHVTGESHYVHVACAVRAAAKHPVTAQDCGCLW